VKATTAICMIMIAVSYTACGGEQKGAKEPGISASQGIARVLEAYETVRSALARDDFGTLTTCAANLEIAAHDALDSVPEQLKPGVTDVQAAAKRLKEMDKGDARAVRLVFGDTSRPVVTLLASEPSLRTGHFVFECPMAQGYKKWVQTSSDISNPYMGKAMPKCGSAAEWTQEAGGR